VSAEGKFAYPTGKQGALELGYDPGLLEQALDGLLGSFCGVGNPFSLGPIREGEEVLDVGCGAGLDLYIAAKLVGHRGRVCGIDVTSEMIDRAEQNLRAAGVTNAELTRVEPGSIPYGEGTFDVVISNGVINLAQDKAALFREIHRVLKPAGRLQFADVVLEKELPASLSGSADAWSQ
jgi:arsenite methyltransferase